MATSHLNIFAVLRSKSLILDMKILRINHEVFHVVKSVLFLDFEVNKGSKVCIKKTTYFKVISNYCTASELLVKKA